MQSFIGTSGWQYKNWRGDFYPADLVLKKWLEFYISQFNSVEVNSSFYRMPLKSSLQSWAKIAEPNKKFLFSLKLYLLFTRYKKLNLQSADLKVLREFLANALELGNHLGPVLVQLPPNLKFSADLLEKFLDQAVELGDKLQAKTFRFAIEFRNKTWLNSQTQQILKSHGAALVISDSPRWPTEIAKTTDFVFARFHGKPAMFYSNYSEQSLQAWAEQLRALKPKKLFCYFNNDAAGHAPHNAKTLAELLQSG